LAFLHPNFTISLINLHSQKSSKEPAIPAVLLNQIDEIYGKFGHKFYQLIFDRALIPILKN